VNKPKELEAVLSSGLVPSHTTTRNSGLPDALAAAQNVCLKAR
jgi:hypothetical protein